jgi:hypothetical protein
MLKVPGDKKNVRKTVIARFIAPEGQMGRRDLLFDKYQYARPMPTSEAVS